MNAVAKKIQAFLFMEGGSLSWKRLSQLIDEDDKTTKEAAKELAQALSDSGLALVETEREVALVTAPEVSDGVRKAFEQQLQRDIGDAGLEVLATLLYRGPSKRSEIDYIRGVNTVSTTRTLLARGLVERSVSSTDAREYVYRPTVELLAHLGVRSSDELPEYATIRAELAAFEESRSPFDQHATDTGLEKGNTETEL